MMANALLTKSLSIFNSYVNCACPSRVVLLCERLR